MGDGCLKILAIALALALLCLGLFAVRVVEIVHGIPW